MNGHRTIICNSHDALVAQEVTKEENVEVIGGYIARMIDV
jgi:hypothetical protein